MTESVPDPGLCPGSGAWVDYGWNWYPCPDCGARVYRGFLGLVDHQPGERGEQPARDEPIAQD
jgi:hypothetical protein